MEIFLLFAGITALGLLAYLFQIWAIRAHVSQPLVHSGEGSSLPRFFLPVSVLKPLKGLDDNLFDNLESFCLQDYPQYEVIFCLQDYNDPAYKVARKIRDKYPDKDISILVERCDAGLNPKVNNLIPAYRASKYPCILISDSNVHADKNYLKSIAGHMDNPEIGLVSNLIKGTGGRSMGAILENLHLNSFVMGSVCFLDKCLKMPCVVGKSMLMRKSDLEAIGGFAAVKDVLAEDYLIGKKMHESGRKVVLSSYRIQNVNEYWDLGRFLNRHTRWGKLRWRIGGAAYISELIANPVFLSLLPMLLWGPSKVTVSFTMLVSLIKIAGDFYIGRKVGAAQRNPLFYLLSPIKDILIGLIWFVPLFSSTVTWRGNKYIIGKNSMLYPRVATGVWSWSYRIVNALKEKFA
ncbi:MAG TPA: glycosyltransferase [Dissulfurispiraceae bacterium]